MILYLYNITFVSFVVSNKFIFIFFKITNYNGISIFYNFNQELKSNMNEPVSKRMVVLAVMAAALGFFVDAHDFLL